MMVTRRADGSVGGAGGPRWDSPRLVVIKGRKNPSMADAAHGLSGLHERAGGPLVMAHSSPTAMTVNLPDRMHDLPEKITLSGKSCHG
jgi:hypothetical protein